VTHFHKLVGSRCYLSPPEPEDAERWAAFENDLRVALPLGDEAYSSISVERERENIAGLARGGDPVFSIVDLETDETIGRCMLFSINPVGRSAMLGIMIGDPRFRGRGYGGEAIRLLLDYGFNLLNLHSVMLGVFEFNTPAIRCYQKAGFREIGRRREVCAIGGRFYDGILMDILDHEFRAANVSVLPAACDLLPE
jgi:RimJ/RimL family protein N-acetyltransferase